MFSLLAVGQRVDLFVLSHGGADASGNNQVRGLLAGGDLINSFLEKAEDFPGLSSASPRSKCQT